MNPLLMMIAFAAGIGLAGAPARAQVDTKAGIVLNVSEVNVLLTVVDRRGHFVDGLTKSDFQVSDNGHSQQLSGLATAGEMPLRVALVIDASNSVREQFRAIQTAAADLMKSVARPQIDRVLLVSFGSQVEAEQELNGEALTKAILELRPGGGTSLYDAIGTSIREKLGGAYTRKFRQALILLSDGEDTQSYNTRDQALQAANNAGVVIYAISTTTEQAETHGDKVLKYFADETGGHAFYPFKFGDKAAAYRRIADEISHQYSIYYRPEPLNSDGKYHAISIGVKGRKNLVIKARKGYYAPKS